MPDQEKVRGWYIPTRSNGSLSELLKFGDAVICDHYPSCPPVDPNLFSLPVDHAGREPFTYHRFIVNEQDDAVECIKIVDEEIMIYTVYVDSISWDDSALWSPNSTDKDKQDCLAAMNTSGDGTKENPWRNLNYALDNLMEEHNSDCLLLPMWADCHPAVRVVVTGVIDYTIKTTETFYAMVVNNQYIPSVILDFQTTQDIEHKELVDYSCSLQRASIFYPSGVAFYNLKSTAKLTVAYNGNCCPDIDMSCTGYLVRASGAYLMGAFYNCDLTLVVTTTAKDGPGNFNDKADLHNNATAFGVYDTYSCWYASNINVSASCYSYDGSDGYAPCDVGASGVSSTGVFQNCTIKAQASGQAVETNSESGGSAEAYADSYGSTYYVTARNCNFIAEASASASASDDETTRAYAIGSNVELHPSNYVSKETCTGTRC